MKSFNINNLETPIRLDKWLKHNCHLHYELIQKLIRKSDIKVNRKKVFKDYKLVNGDIITIYAKLIEQAPPTARKLDQKLYFKLLTKIKEAIIFKDENIIAINKPYGIATQSGSKIKISIDDILDDLKFEYEIRPRLVHRLDKYTTGVLLLARTKQVAISLTNLFKNNLVKKKYLAVVVGNLKNKTGIIKSKIAKLGSEDIKEAITKYKMLSSSSNPKISLIEFIPITGRTHQIRIHAAKELHCPIVGDTKYGNAAAIVLGLEKKMHLHSSGIKIKNLLRKNYSLKTKLPKHMNLSIKKYLANV